MDFLENIPPVWRIFIVVFYVILSWAEERVDDVLNYFSGENSFLGAIREFFMLISERIDAAGDDAERLLMGIAGRAAQNILEQGINGLISASNILKDHVRYVAVKLLAQDTEHTGWRILGATIQFFLLGLFFYADIAQGYNNLSSMEIFKEMVVPEFFQNLAIPIIVSSVVSVAALSHVLFDLLGLTHFAPWDQLSETPKKILTYLVIGLLVISVTSSILIGFSRLPEFVEMSSETVALIDTLAGVAQNVVFFPMLIVTLLLIWGFAGFFVIYIGLVGLVIAFLGLLQLPFGLLNVVVKILGSIFMVLIKLLLFILQYLFLLIGMILDWLLKLIILVHKLIDFATFPIREVIKWVKSAIKWIINQFSRRPVP